MSNESNKIVFKPIYLPQNKGLGNALREALFYCNFNLVARMDSDDISASYRFEKQLDKFIADKNLDVVGGYITEFIGSPEKITGVRTVQLIDEAIQMDMKKRCAMNHVTVMYKKEAVQTSGGYLDWYYNEDYYLWIRMLEKGYKFGNVPYPLVNVRIGTDMSARRGGWKYFQSERLIQKYAYNHHLISFSRYFYNVLLRFCGEVVASNSIRQLLFKMVRKKYNPKNNPTNIAKNEINRQDYPPFSVAMSVYKNDNPEWFDQALESIIINQTVKPSEVVLVVDGPVSNSIQDVINKYEKICGGGVGFKIIKLSKNSGLGFALNVAVNNCNNEFIARMDSDDIALSHRFCLQLNKFLRDKEIDICGGQIEEFIDTPTNIIAKRIVPETNEEIKLFMKKRCPFNHMTVMFKKSAVLEAGNYQDWFWNEDYYLWIRMALKGHKFANVSETLVKVRVGKDMYARRGGAEYFRSEIGIQKLMLEKGLIDTKTYISNYAKRYIVQKMMPNSIRAWVFKKFARS